MVPVPTGLSKGERSAGPIATRTEKDTGTQCFLIEKILIVKPRRLIARVIVPSRVCGCASPHLLASNDKNGGLWHNPSAATYSRILCSSWFWTFGPGG